MTVLCSHRYPLTCAGSCVTCRKVVRQLAENEAWQLGWAFDGQKNLYAPRMFLPQHETNYEA